MRALWASDDQKHCCRGNFCSRPYDRTLVVPSRNITLIPVGLGWVGLDFLGLILPLSPTPIAMCIYIMSMFCYVNNNIRYEPVLIKMSV